MTEMDSSIVDSAVQASQAWPVPSHPRPIVSIGAGAIVRTSHLPAYRRLGLPVAGVFDVRSQVAHDTAAMFGVPAVYESLDAAVAVPDAVFDLAVPGGVVLGILDCLPHGAPVLIQKPMGEDLGTALRILDACRSRRLVAAVNFQLRFSPNVLVLRELLHADAIGDLTDIEVRLNVRQPWETWSFFRGAPRLEVLYHSIHYLDTIRLLAGEPRGVFCRALPHPHLPDFADARSSILLDYGPRIRASLLLNHMHEHAPAHRASFLKVEGTRGSALLTMGVNLDYPNGGPDRLEVAPRGGAWTDIPLRGSWFTEAFEGPMANLQRVVTGEDPSLVSSVADAARTMALVEACYQANSVPATPIPPVA